MTTVVILVMLRVILKIGTVKSELFLLNVTGYRHLALWQSEYDIQMPSSSCDHARIWMPRNSQQRDSGETQAQEVVRRLY